MVYKFKDNVRFFETESEAYLEVIDKKEKYPIGGAGVNFVKLIDGKRDLDSILEALITMYGPNVEPYVLATDLEGFIAQLFECSLIEVVKTINCEGK